MCTKDHYHMMFATWDMECERHNFLSFWAILCPFTPNPFTQVYHKWRSNDIWFLRYKAQQAQQSFFVILGHFSHFDRPNPKNQKFEKIKKNPWRYSNFTLVYHKWQSYDVCFWRYGAWQKECFVILDCYFVIGYYFMYYYGIYYGNNDSSFTNILSSMFYALDIWTLIY